MGQFIEFVAALLETFLPRPWNQYTAVVLVVFAIAGVAYGLARLFVSRRVLYIKPFTVLSWPGNLSGEHVAGELRKNIKLIHEIHSEKALTSAAYASSIGDLKHVNEDLGGAFDTLLSAVAVSDPFTGLLLAIGERLWPPIVLQGEVDVQEGALHCSARLSKGSKQIAVWPLNERASLPDSLARVIKTLAFRVVFDAAGKGLINKDSSIGTCSWQAFKAHTDALSHWQNRSFDANNAEQVRRVDELLQKALEYDPEYAMVHFNRGLLTYLSHHAVSSNETARAHFQTAIRILSDPHHKRNAAGQRDDRRVEGLAYVGLARCYCQDRHRYGRLSMDVVHKAREAAQRANELLDGDSKALHALAFAWHCTEALDDIREGRRIYEKIIKQEGGNDPHAHNNLGYILMIGAKLLMADRKVSEAEAWYQEAEEHMRTTIELAKPNTRLIDFSYANLGNLYRLRHDYEQAIDFYWKALRSDPEHSSYTNGLNELSLVYFDLRRPSEALHYHERALSLTEDREQLLKLMVQVVDTLVEGEHPAAATLRQTLDEIRGDTSSIDRKAWTLQLDSVLRSVSE